MTLAQKDGYICPSTEVFGTTSIIWGVICPARQFSSRQVYCGMSLRVHVCATC